MSKKRSKKRYHPDKVVVYKISIINTKYSIENGARLLYGDKFENIDERFSNVIDWIYYSFNRRTGKFDHKILIVFEYLNSSFEYQIDIKVNKFRINIKDILPQIHDIIIDNIKY